MTPEARAIRLIEEIERAPREVGPVSLEGEYLRAIDWVESLPKNQSGADKSWVPNAQAEFLSHYRNARPL